MIVTINMKTNFLIIYEMLKKITSITLMTPFSIDTKALKRCFFLNDLMGVAWRYIKESGGNLFMNPTP